jgi:hypothetical protein
MTLNEEDSKLTKGQLEHSILIIKAGAGLVSGIIGFLLFEIFNCYFLIVIIFSFVFGLTIPLIPIYLLYRKNLNQFGSILRLISYGFLTYILVYTAAYTILFLITAYI